MLLVRLDPYKKGLWTSADPVRNWQTLARAEVSVDERERVGASPQVLGTSLPCSESTWLSSKDGIARSPAHLVLLS